MFGAMFSTDSWRPEVEKLASRGSSFLICRMWSRERRLLLGSPHGRQTSASFGAALEDVCYSIQEVAFAMLAEASERALAHTQKSELLLTGGSCKRQAQKMLSLVAEDHVLDSWSYLGAFW